MINLEMYDIYEISAGCAFGFIVASAIFLILISKLRHEIKKLKKQYEKKSIGMDDSSLKVKALENKIQALEAALKKQMEK